MSITLTPEQETWLKARVGIGDFTSIEAAARQLIDERIAELVAEELRRKERREVLRVGDLSDADLEAIATTEMHPRHQHLDNELR